MIYDYKYLRNLSYEDKKIPLARYLYKFKYHRTEIKKLKTHEKEFLFDHMYLLKDEKEQVAFDLTSINEASEYYFNRLILIYSKNLNFNRPTKNHLGQIIDNFTMEKDKNYFNNYYKIWQEQLKTKKGKYLNIVQTELSKKIKELDNELQERQITTSKYNYQIKYINSIAFYIYYKVKLFFDGLTSKFVCLNILEEKIVINIYSFIHILFRHYFPTMDNTTSNRSLNSPLPFLDIENLPDSIKDFLVIYFSYDKSKLLPSREYLLFSFKDDKYIIWLKYGQLEELGGDNGFEVRTLYKCVEHRDLDKFKGLVKYDINNSLSFYF